MACFNPLLGYYSRERSANGRRKIVFDKSLGYVDRPVALPCGQCIGCRLEKSRQWAVRCMHEASTYDNNCSITLTYRDDALPPFFLSSVSSVSSVVSASVSSFVGTGSLNSSHFVLFMKKLRKRYGNGIRFYACGEYGDRFERPHYHALLFNHDFADKVVVKREDRSEFVLFESKALSELWEYGSHKIGNVTFDSAAYVARYVCKKLTGPQALKYTFAHPETGEVLYRQPEFGLMSRRPGIGAKWIEKFENDVYPSDFIVANGVKMGTLRYYDTKYSETKAQEFEIIRRKRVRRARKYISNNTPERLKARAMVARAKLRLKARNLEGE